MSYDSEYRTFYSVRTADLRDSALCAHKKYF
jgi:hypothetical protein